MARIGWVDTFTATCIAGWAADDEDAGLQVSVDIFVNGKLMATVPATAFRDDLRLAGMGDGCKSFQFDPDPYLRRGWNYVQVKYSGSEILLGRGQGRLNTRPPIVLTGADPFLAALAAYYPFSPDRHICEVGQGFHRLRRAVRQAKLPFRRYTVREWRHGNIRLPDTADLVISTALPSVTEALLGLLGHNRERPRHLALEFQRGPEAVPEIRRALTGSGVTGVRFDSLPAGLFAFAELGATQTAEEPAPVLAHIHVPKCAGTSLRNLLERHFGTKHMRLYVDDTYFVYAASELRTALLSDPAVRAFSSHHVRTFPAWVAGHRMFYVTFLRDPVQQFVSYMTHIKKHYAGITAQSLLEAVPPDTPCLSLRDFAKWLLTNERDVPFRENHNVNFFARHTAPQAGDRLQAAKNALAGFLFVGITECMDESMRQLRVVAESAGLDFPAEAIAVENTSNEFRGDLSWIHPSDEVGSLLLRSVELDRQLYDWAQARLKAGSDQAP